MKKIIAEVEHFCFYATLTIVFWIGVLFYIHPDCINLVSGLGNLSRFINLH